MGSRVSSVGDLTTASIVVSEVSFAHAAVACAGSVSRPWRESLHCAESQQQDYVRDTGAELGIALDEGLAAGSSAIEFVAADVVGGDSFGSAGDCSSATRLGAAFEVVAVAESPLRDASRHVVAGAGEARAREEVDIHYCRPEREGIGLGHSSRLSEEALRCSLDARSSSHCHRQEMLGLASHLANYLATGSWHNGSSDCCGSSSQTAILSIWFAIWMLSWCIYTEIH